MIDLNRSTLSLLMNPAQALVTDLTFFYVYVSLVTEDKLNYSFSALRYGEMESNVLTYH